MERCLSRIVSITLAERGSMRNTVPASSLATHTAPAPAATAVGFAPTSIRSSPPSPDLASIFTTLRSTSEATQIAPKPAAMPAGRVPDLDPSYRTLFALDVDLQHAAFAPGGHPQGSPGESARPTGSSPTGIVVRLLPSGSMRETVPSRRFATQTEPAPDRERSPTAPRPGTPT